MALNLSRNTKLFVSTSNSFSAGAHDGTTTINTWEIPVLDGYTFSQTTANQEVTINEAGVAPVRGTSVFNTALNPAELSFSTYIRPYNLATGSGTNDAIEKPLWEIVAGGATPTTAGTNAKRGAGSNAPLTIDFEQSNINQLGVLHFFFQLQNTTYLVKDVTITSATIDFSIDAIAQIAWSGSGTTISEGDTSAWVAGTNYVQATTINDGVAADFIRNKLSTVSVVRTSNDAGNITEGSQVVTFTSPLNLESKLGSFGSTYDGVNTYSARITVDGGSVQTLSFNTASTLTYNGAAWDLTTGASGTTIRDVINEINYQLTDAIAFLDEDGNIKVVSQTAGTSSSILVQDDLGTPSGNAIFADMTGTFSAIAAAVAGTGTPVAYTVPITGGSLTIENNVSYLTPEELGVVNLPLPGFAGSRTISGTLTAYLNTGTSNTGGLLADMLANLNTVTHDFEVQVNIGGTSTPRVELKMPSCHLSVPSVNVEDVISTEISFTALGTDITTSDELYISYYGS